MAKINCFVDLAAFFSRVTGRPISPQDLEQFKEPRGNYGEPIYLSTGNVKLFGYSEPAGNGGFCATFFLQPGGARTREAQRLYFDKKVSPIETVRRVLEAVAALHQDPGRASQSDLGSVCDYNCC